MSHLLCVPFTILTYCIVLLNIIRRSCKIFISFVWNTLVKQQGITSRSQHHIKAHYKREKTFLKLKNLQIIIILIQCNKTSSTRELFSIIFLIYIKKAVNIKTRDSVWFFIKNFYVFHENVTIFEIKRVRAESTLNYYYCLSRTGTYYSWW